MTQPEFEPAEVAHAKDIVQDALYGQFDYLEELEKPDVIGLADDIVEALLRAGVYFPAQLVSPYTNLPANARPDGLDLIRAERTRQIEQEGYTTAHDEDFARYNPYALSLAAASYALPAFARKVWTDDGQPTPGTWPWNEEHWKPTPDDRIRELTKAGALILAELDRLITQQRRNDLSTQ